MARSANRGCSHDSDPEVSPRARTGSVCCYDTEPESGSDVEDRAVVLRRTVSAAGRTGSAIPVSRDCGFLSERRNQHRSGERNPDRSCHQRSTHKKERPLSGVTALIKFVLLPSITSIPHSHAGNISAPTGPRRSARGNRRCPRSISRARPDSPVSRRRDSASARWPSLRRRQSTCEPGGA